MNGYAWLILVFLVAEFLLYIIAGRLNRKHMAPKLPAEFRGVWDEDTYAQSQRYLSETSRFGAAASSVHLAILLAFWFAGGFGWADGLARSLGLGPVATGLVFLGGLGAAWGLASLPFSAYATFVIEERYGFNKTTLNTFIIDRVKMAGLAVVIGGPLLAAILAFFNAAGAWAWVWCWAASTVFIVALQFVLPWLILPLFNKFEPLGPGELKDAVFAYAQSQGLVLDNILVMDGSRRSGKANAFFTGLGKKKRIALFDTLIERHATEELVAVLAHETGHYKLRHVLKGMALAVCHLGALFFVLGLFLKQQGLFEAFFVEHASAWAGLLFFGLLFSPAETLLGVGVNALSRRWEFAADRFAARTPGLGPALALALAKLSRDNLANLTPHPLYVALHYSHPPVLARIRALSAR